MKRLLSLYILLFWCISFSTAQRVVFTPKWTAQAQFTGYYVADKMGFYKDEGLDVYIQHPSVAESSFSFLEKGRAQVVVMNFSQALTSLSAGTSVVNIMQTSQVNSLMLVSHIPLKGIASLNNKKIAVWNHLSQDLLDMLSKKYNLNVEWIRFNSGVNLFLSKAVDICLVGSYNEYLQLAEYGMDIDPAYVFKFADYGYNLPEDGLYVTQDYYNQHKGLVHKFVKASIRGWEWVNHNREEALDIVMERVHKDNIGTNRYHQRKMLEEVLRLQCDPKTSKRTYKLSKKDFEQAVEILIPKDIIEKYKISYQNFVK